MRILVVNYEYPPVGGGGGVIARDLAEQMALMGHPITVVTSHFKGLSIDVKVNGLRVIRVPVFFRRKLEVANNLSMLNYVSASVLYCIRHFSRKDFDIIHTHFAVPSGPAGYALSRCFGLPQILSIHGGDIYDPSKKASPHRMPVLSDTVAFMLNSATRVVAQSKNTKENAVTYYRPKTDIDIIPLGIKEPAFIKGSRAAFGLKNDEFVFCTIGRLIRRKNLEEALQILSRMKGEFRFRFLIIGDGPQREHLKEHVAALGLSHHVRLLGNVSDEVKYQVLDVSDCYLSTALHEGFGLVFLEAMAFGLPIVCHNHGGQTDFLRNEESGFLTPLGDIETTLARMRLIMNDNELRKRISASNRARVRDFFISRCAERYLWLFEEIIKAGKNRTTRR